MTHRAPMSVGNKHPMAEGSLSTSRRYGTNYSLAFCWSCLHRCFGRLLTCASLNEKINVYLVACECMEGSLIFNIGDEKLGPQGENDFPISTSLDS